MAKPVRKIKIDLSKFDSTWEGSYILVSTSGFNDQKDFALKLSKREREVTKLSRLYKKADRVLNKLIEDQKDEGAEYELAEKEEERLHGESEKASIGVLEYMQGEVVKRFMEGKIHDGEKLREMTKEDVLDFDLDVLGEISRAIGGQNSKND